MLEFICTGRSFLDMSVYAQAGEYEKKEIKKLKIKNTKRETKQIIKVTLLY